jgi:hypothetical protein
MPNEEEIWQLMEVRRSADVRRTAQARGATSPAGTPAQSWQAMAQGRSSLTHTGMATVRPAFVVSIAG